MDQNSNGSNKIYPDEPDGTSSRSSEAGTKALKKFAALASLRLKEQNFYEKECDQICPKKDKPELCQCGLKLVDHSSEVQHKPLGLDWDSQESTKKTPWRCFGTIRFKNQDTINKNSPYMRINDDVDVSQLVEYVHEKWQLSKPSLIISVTGGAADFAMKKKDHERLKQGLQRVAATKGAWLITGGTNAGIMRICGEAARDQILTSNSNNLSNEVITIGIATWGAVKGREYLVPPLDHDPGMVFEAQYQKPLVGTGLDPNHTHFIFADDGSKNTFGKEQSLRGKFESVLRQNGVAKEGTEVPIVCLMVEGGVGTIDTVRNALINGTPCIIIDGSGRAADVLSYAVDVSDKLDLDKSMVVETKKRKLEKEIRSKSKLVLKLPEVSLMKSVKWILECLKYRGQIRIFKLDDEDGESAGDLDKAILQTLLEMGGLDVRTQLHLSLLWNRNDMAEEVIVKNKKHLHVRDLEEFLTQALVDNKLEFVKLFVERVPLANFLTKNKLENLYNDTMQVSDDKFLLETLESFEGNVHKTRSLEDIQNALLSVADVEYSPQFDLKDQKDEVCKGLPKGNKVKMNKKQLNSSQFEHPERELFVYSLLFSRHEMSRYFWEEMICKTSGALFAMLLTKSMLKSSSVQVDTHRQNLIEKIQKDYEDKAVGVLNACYASGAKKTQTLLKVQHKCWGDKTCLNMALDADSKEFLSQSACQTLIREIWRGNISDRNSIYGIILAVLLPVFVYGIWFKSDINKELKQLEKLQRNTQKEKQKSLEGSTIEASINDVQNGGLSSRSQKEEGDVTNVNSSLGGLSLIDRYHFFYTAPIVTFILNCAFNLIFLVLFSYVVMAGLKDSPSIVEFLVVFWVLTLPLEEAREFIMTSEPNWKKKIKNFFGHKWNIIDWLALFPFVPGLVLRCQPDWGALHVAHSFYVTSLLIFFIRFPSFFSMHSILGPKIVMISKMIKDLGFFMCIAFVYIIAYGIAIQSLIYPGVTNPHFTIPWGIFFRPYFEMLGNPAFPEIGAVHLDNCNPSTDSYWPYNDCPEGNRTIFAVILKALYMLFTNVLLLNLLIAIFNNRYETVNEQSNIYWKFQMFLVIKDYYNKPYLPPPFIIVSHIYNVVVAIKNREIPRMRGLTAQPKDVQKLEKWENIRAKEYATIVEQKEQENIEEKVRKIEGKSVAIERTASHIQSELLDIRLDLSSQKNQMVTLESDFKELNKTVAQINERGQRIEDMMTMLLQSFSNPSEPLRIQTLELER